VTACNKYYLRCKGHTRGSNLYRFFLTDSWTSEGYSRSWKVAKVIYRCTIAYSLPSFRFFASSYKAALISECRYVYRSWAERAARLVVYEMSTRCLTVSSDRDLTAAAATKHLEKHFNLPGMSLLFLSQHNFNLLLQKILQLAWKTGWVGICIEKEFWDFLSMQISRWPGSGSGFKSLPNPGNTCFRFLHLMSI